jgi:hypothetical protein
MNPRGMRTTGRVGADLEAQRQTLPIPIGGLTPVHRRTRSVRQLGRRRQPVCLASLGALAAALGVVITLSPTTIAAFGDASTIHIGSSLMQRGASPAVPGSRLYVGDVSIVMVPDRSGWRAAATTTLNGQPARGVCNLEDTVQTATETCTFTLGGQTLRATDVFDASAGQWHREYSDGVKVMFSVPSRASLVPIPIPFGHS